MTYVFDTNSFSRLFGCYPQNIFLDLWTKYNWLVSQGRITSTLEVLKELGNSRKSAAAHTWGNANKALFPAPSAVESQFVATILAVPHFQQIIPKKQQIVGVNADVLIIARANALRGTVVTEESMPPNGARIPNICSHFSIPCINLDEFMQQENWSF